MPFNGTTNINKLTDDLSLQIHLLRHFSSLPEKYQEFLENKSIFSVYEIQQMIKLTGSKFHPDFASDPRALLKKTTELLRAETFIEKREENKLILTHFFSSEKYPAGIGYDCVVELSAIDSEQLERINNEKRGSYIIRKIASKPPVTFQLNIIFYIDDANQIQNIKTIFPGQMAPPFPDSSNMNDEQLSESRLFWENHLFVEF